MRQVLVICLFILWPVSEKLYSQVAISYFPFQSVLSISSDTENLLWGEMRVGTNTFFSNINLEFDAQINFKRTNWVNYYSGLGINVNPFYGIEDLPFTNGYVLNIGARIKPVQAHKNLQVVFEISPYVNSQFDGGLLRTYLGLAYNF